MHYSYSDPHKNHDSGPLTASFHLTIPTRHAFSGGPHPITATHVVADLSFLMFSKLKQTKMSFKKV